MTIIEKLLSKWTKQSLIWQQKKNIASLQTLENYFTNCILKGDEMSKGKLVDTQTRLNESVRFLNFLTNK